MIGKTHALPGDPDIRGQIAETLRRASDPQLIRIMTYIDRLPTRRRVDDLVSHVRDRLAAVRPPRPLTLARVLALPFADLLAETALAAASPRLIPRNVMSGLHGLLPQALDARRRVDLEARISDRTLNDHAIVHEVGAVLWPAMAHALQGVLRAPASRSEGALLTCRPQLPMLVEILNHGTAIAGYLDELPARPIGPWLPVEYQAARNLLATARTVSDSLARSCFMMLMRRSAAPEELFTLVSDPELSLPDALRQRLLEEAGLTCVAEAETMTDHMTGTAERSAAMAARAAQRLATLVTAMERAPPGSAVTGQRLSAIRTRACAAITQAFTHSLETELPHAATLLGGSRPARDEDVLAAEGLARSIRKIELAGARLGLGRRLDASLHDRISDCTRRVSGRLKNTADTPGGPLAVVMDDLRFIEILFGADAAMKLLPTDIRIVNLP